MPLWADNGEEAAPETPVPRVKGATAALTGEKARVARFRDFTLEETETHKRNCKLGKLNQCGRCRYWDLMANDHSRFAMLRLRPTDELAFKSRKVEVLAKLPWLALRHDNIKGGAWVGCMACHAYVRERPQKAKANPYADVHIKAARLVDRAKPHIMMRHAKTRLRLQAVAAMLDVPCGAQVNILLKDFQQYRWPPGCSCASRSFGDPLSPISFRILTGRSFRHCSAGPHKLVTQVSPRGC